MTRAIREGIPISRRIDPGIAHMNRNAEEIITLSVAADIGRLSLIQQITRGRKTKGTAP